MAGREQDEDDLVQSQTTNPSILPEIAMHITGLCKLNADKAATDVKTLNKPLNPASSQVYHAFNHLVNKQTRKVTSSMVHLFRPHRSHSRRNSHLLAISSVSAILRSRTDALRRP